MPEEIVNYCGTGSWSGPVAGDPDNNITVSATVTYGGITVSWTLPLTNPQAVAHYRIYRGLTADPGFASLHAVSGGNQFFDQSRVQTPPRYYYWIEILSVHGTVGAKVGPATAQASDTIAELIERLTGQIDSGLLATSLRGELDQIQTLNTSLIGEVATRINDNGVLAGIIADVQGEVATALTYIYNETTSRIAADSAALDSYNVLAAAVGGSLASFVSQISLLATDVEANASAITALTVSLGDDIATVATTAQANIDALAGVVNALYTVKLTVNGLVGGFGLTNDGDEVEAGFDVDTFWVGRTSADKVKPFIISGGVVYIDSAMISTLAADQIDTRGLTIKDGAGNILFGSGDNLDWTRISGAGKAADGATRNVFQGAWLTGTGYLVGDIVIEGGYGWSATAAHISSAIIRPPTYPVTSNSYWGLYTVKGDAGAAGANGTRTAILDMYRNSATDPTTFPSGSSTYTWATGLFTAPATPNSWSLTPPAPVGGQDLYVVRQLYSDNNTTSTSTVGWAATTSRISAASGEPGTDGVNGARVGFLEVYQWAVSAPVTFPSGTSTYTWATGAFTAPSTPAGWALLPGAHVAGQTLWACSVRVANNTTVTTDSVTWATATAYAVGASGANGVNTLTVAVSNEVHVLPASSAGVVSSYAGSGTQIRVYEGATELLYDGSGATASTWTVSSAVSNIVRGSLTDSGSFLTVGDHSAVADGVDVSSITYTITGKTAANASFSLVKTQTFSKSKAGATGSTGSAGPALVVTSDRPATFTATDGTLDGAQANLVLNAATQGLVSPTFAWTFSGLQTNPTASTTASQTITAAQFGTAKSAIVTCTVNGSLVDKVTIVRLEKSTASAGATVNQTDAVTNAAILAAQTQANTAVTNAATAQTTANTANTTLSDIASDSKLTPVEKQSLRVEWTSLYEEKSGINAAATAQGVTTEHTTYNTNFQALGTYLNGGAAYTIGVTPPLWITDAQLSVTTDITGATFRTNWASVYLARQAVLNKIAEIAATKATWATVTGSGRPADNATVGATFGTNIGGQITSGNVSTYIAAAAIGNAQIGGAIQSNDYSAGVAGWIINKDGTAEFNSGTFRGTLAAASGTFGTLTVTSTGHIKGGQTAYNTGTGFWLGMDSGTPKFSIGNSAGSNMKWDGSNLLFNNVTFDDLSASITGGNLTVSVSYDYQSYGSRTVAVTGGKSPFKYNWIVQKTDAMLFGAVSISSGATTATATFGGNGDATTNNAVVVCIVTDSNGRVTNATFNLTASHSVSPG